MIIGIVGSEAAKFTKAGEAQAREMIRTILTRAGATEVVSGACHLGGIDAWAIEVGREMGLKVREFPPATRQWEGGYKQRNIQIARASDEMHCITINKLPVSYTGMRFPYCYHCSSAQHIKSGGCWTVKFAMRLGKPGEIHVVKQEETEALWT